MAKKPKKPDADKNGETIDENSLNISVDDGAADTAGDGQAGDGQAGDGQAAPATEPAGEPAGEPMLSVLAQYTRDMSFENPNAPDSLRSGQPAPEVNIDLRIGREIGENDTVEISILIKAQAVRGDQTIFIAELDYAGLFGIKNVGVEQIQPLMMIECPRILFPYARKILADMTQDGGHMPIMLDMPDFAGMFRDEMMRRAKEQGLN
ncbi:protein-export chaperone SecB [uncultured Algimonas sp.]|uniref:protein-export chaperone SecB n=1 Tax=uncultured Algimonas sp. TaxID=1547920 RepID=UPI0026071982|nr:protein-export chaperone SecB [uncultured Algimonas sp.]